MQVTSSPHAGYRDGGSLLRVLLQPDRQVIGTAEVKQRFTYGEGGAPGERNTIDCIIGDSFQVPGRFP